MVPNRLRYLRSDVAKDFIHDADQRLCGIDDDAAAGDVFLCSMQLGDEFLFLWLSAPVRRVACHALIDPPIQGVKVIDLQNKNTIQQIDER